LRYRKLREAEGSEVYGIDEKRADQDLEHLQEHQAPERPEPTLAPEVEEEVPEEPPPPPPPKVTLDEWNSEHHVSKILAQDVRGPENPEVIVPAKSTEPDEQLADAAAMKSYKAQLRKMTAKEVKKSASTLDWTTSPGSWGLWQRAVAYELQMRQPPVGT
jgi:hypothetical protein